MRHRRTDADHAANVTDRHGRGGVGRGRLWRSASLQNDLNVKLLVDDGHCLQLEVPGLRASAQVAPRHHHRLDQQPAGAFQRVQ